MYNKFRSPSFAQVIPQFTIAIIAALSLQKLLFGEKSKELLKADFKKILYTVGGLFALLGYDVYDALDTVHPIDGSELLANKADKATMMKLAELFFQD